jgi:hypothetical protein
VGFFRWAFWGFLGGFFWVGFLLPPCHKDKVKAHVRTVHERVRYGCSTCDYTTPRADKLRRHVAVVHQGLVYQCQLCEYSAVRPEKLKNHMTTHHQPGQQQQLLLSCQLCQFTTPSAAELMEHKVRANHRDRPTTNGSAAGGLLSPEET